MTEPRPPADPPADSSRGATPQGGKRRTRSSGRTSGRGAGRTSGRSASLGSRLRSGLERSRRPQPQGTQAVVTTALTMLVLLSVWLLLQMLLLSGLAQNRSQDLLYPQFRTDVANGVAPIGPVVDPGTPVALVQIPAIGLEQVVVEGTASGDTLAGPGHQRNTVLPGQDGTSVVVGRAVTYGAPFADLTSLHPGDEIDVVIAQGTTTFRVIDIRHTGDPLPQPREPGHARLVLVTGEGDGRLARLSPSEAVYVDAESTKAFAAPPGRPSAIPESEQVMQGEPGVLPLLCLWLAALLVLTLGIVAARQRWSVVRVWVVASPIAIALAWITSDTIVRLLPNVI